MAKRFIIDDATGALYEDFTARRVVSAADILEAEGGASETIQIYLVTHNPQTRAVTTTSIATANVSLDIGVPGASPTAGKVIVSYGGESTAELPVASLTADSLGAALNRLDAVESDGGVDVWPAGDPDQLNFYVRLQNTGAPGTNPSIDTDGTTPPSSAEVTVITAGSSSERALWLVQIAEAPVASIAESAWSTVTSGSFGGLTAALSLNGKGLLAHLAKDNPPPLTMTVKNSGSVLMRGTIPAFQAVDPADLNGSAIISIFPRIVTSTSNPTVNDDSGNGYAVGSLWVNTSTPSAFLLMANTAGAANWDELTETGTGQLLAANNLSDLASASTARTNLGAQATITGAATTIDTEDLTASRAIVSNGSGKIAVSDVTSTELGYLDGVSSAIQTQLDAKQATLGSSNRLDAANIGANGNVSNTEYGYLASVSADIQTQLDAKLPLAGGTMSGTLTCGSSGSPTYIYYGQWYGGKLSGDLDANSAKLTNLTTGSASGDSINFGQLAVGINDQTGTTYTLVAADGAGAGKQVRLNNASTVTVTVPNNTIEVGSVINLFRKGAGGVTIAAATGVTINSVGAKLKLANQYSGASLICISKGASSEFDLVGDLTT
tara:strand:+ start:579 stop:2405 length:1827 start_codon:yes stop_codon:yes gene_type:complete